MAADIRDEQTATISRVKPVAYEFALKKIELSHLDNFDMGTNMNNAVRSADNIQASS
jgi:hypothetical protein